MSLTIQGCQDTTTSLKVLMGWNFLSLKSFIIQMVILTIGISYLQGVLNGQKGFCNRRKR